MLGSLRPIVAACVLVLAACGGGDGEVVDGGGTGAGEGSVGPGPAGDYRSTSTSTFPLVAGTEVRLSVADGSLSMSAGCNTLGSSFRLDGDRLIVDGVMSTMMGCAEDLAEQDQRLTVLLESQPTVSSSPDGFTLTADDGSTLVFVDREVADPDRALEGTRWTLDAVVTGDTVVSAVGFETVVLMLDGGRATVTTGCSTGVATYVVDGRSVVLGPLELTPTTSACGPAVLEAEAALIGVFGGTATAEVRADSFELRRGDVGVTFREG